MEQKKKYRLPVRILAIVCSLTLLVSGFAITALAGDAFDPDKVTYIDYSHLVDERKEDNTYRYDTLLAESGLAGCQVWSQDELYTITKNLRNSITWYYDGNASVYYYPFGFTSTCQLLTSSFPSGEITGSFTVEILSGENFIYDVSGASGPNPGVAVQMYWYDIDGNYLSVSSWYGGQYYTGGTYTVEFELSGMPDNAYSCTLRVVVSNLEPILSDDVMSARFNDFEMRCKYPRPIGTDAYLDDIQSSLGDINNTLTGSPDQVVAGNEFKNEMVDKTDAVNSVLGQLDVNKPAVDDFDVSVGSITSGVNMSGFNTTLLTITNSNYVSQIMLIVVTIMLVSYVLFGKKG